MGEHLHDLVGADAVITDRSWIDALSGWRGRNALEQHRGKLAVFPASAQECARVIQYAANEGLSWSCQGGGTSVPWFADAPSGSDRSATVADIPDAPDMVIHTTRLNRCLSVDPIARTADVEAGAMLAAVRPWLANAGLARSGLANSGVTKTGFDLPLLFDCPTTATLGGLAATNAHGRGGRTRERLQRYLRVTRGVTRDGTAIETDRLLGDGGFSDLAAAWMQPATNGLLITSLTVDLTSRAEKASSVIIALPSLPQALSLVEGLAFLNCDYVTSDLVNAALWNRARQRPQVTDKPLEAEAGMYAVVVRLAGAGDDVREARLAIAESVAQAGGKLVLARETAQARFATQTVNEVYASLGGHYPSALVEGFVPPARLTETIEMIEAVGADSRCNAAIRVSPSDGWIWAALRGQDASAGQHLASAISGVRTVLEANDGGRDRIADRVIRFVPQFHVPTHGEQAPTVAPEFEPARERETGSPATSEDRAELPGRNDADSSFAKSLRGGDGNA